MREIKFRYVLKDRDSDNIAMLSFDLKFIEEWGTEGIYESFEENFGGECDCLNESRSYCECESIFDRYKIISRDQYTGLKDKNGVEIYFDDLVKAPSGNIFQVVWNDEEMRICLKDKDYFYNFNVPLYETIGNIHQNPELLKIGE